MSDEETRFESRRERREALRAQGGAAVIQPESSYSAAEPIETTASAPSGELPSRRELRRLAQETGVVPTITPEMLRDADEGGMDILGQVRAQTEALREASATVTTPAITPVTESTPAEATAPATSPLSALAASFDQIVTPRESPEIPPASEGDWRDQLTAEAEHGWVENHSSEIGVVQSPTLQTLVVDSYHTGDITGPLNATGEIFITGQILLEPLTEEAPGGTIDAGVDVNQPGIPRRASEALSIIGKPAVSESHKRIPSVGSAVVAGLAAALGALAIAIAALAYFTDIL